MTAFVDIAITGIQRYLGRSRHLRGRRGASEALLAVTDITGQGSTVRSVLSRFPADCPVSVNEETIDIDGVISLRSEDPDAAWRAGEAIARSIRCRLPGATIKVSMRQGNTYRDCLAEGDRPERAETWFPRTYDFPPHKLCDECGQLGASKQVERSDGSVSVCPDCAERIQLSQKTTTQPTRQPGFSAEQWLRKEINVQREAGGGGRLREVDDFEELATLAAGPCASAKKRREFDDNHIATIFADGNGLGALFADARREASRGEEGMAKLRKLSKDIKQVTSDALLAATRAVIGEDDQVVPVVPHIQGGDDVLLTLPAGRAWRFIMEFMTTSEKSYQELGGQTHPTISLGVVICRYAFPFGDQVELAERLLRQAKDQLRGSEMSFAWVDVTWDGPRPVPDRQAWKWSDLERQKGAIAAGAGLPSSSKSTLRTILSVSDRYERQLRLAHQADRMDEVDDFLGSVLGAHWRNTQELDDQTTRQILDVLSLGRWWPWSK